MAETADISTSVPEEEESSEGANAPKEKKSGGESSSGGFNVDAPAFKPRADTTGVEDIMPKLSQRHKQNLRGFYQAYNGEYVSYYVGVLKTFNAKNGYGFVECKQAKEDWGVDVFVHKNNVPTPWTLGQPVEFAVQVNLKGQPQAYDCNWLPRLPQTNAVTPGTTPGLPGKGRTQQGPGSAPGSGPSGPVSAAGAQAASDKPEEETLSIEPRRLGTLKSFSSQHGYGFISCPETNQAYKRDVYLDKSQVGESWQWNQLLEFSVSFNERGQPQARHVNWDPVPLIGTDARDVKRNFAPKTLDQLKRLLKLLHEKNNETAVVTAIDLQGGSGAEQSQEDPDVDYLFFVLDRFSSKEETIKSIKDFVKMLFVLMLSRTLKGDVLGTLQKSRTKTLRLIEWFEAASSKIQMQSEAIQPHIQDVLRQINQHIMGAAQENVELQDKALADKLHAAFTELREKANRAANAVIANAPAVDVSRGP